MTKDGDLVSRLCRGSTLWEAQPCDSHTHSTSRWSAERAEGHGHYPCTGRHARLMRVDSDDGPVPRLLLTSLAEGRWLPRWKCIGSISKAIVARGQLEFRGASHFQLRKACRPPWTMGNAGLSPKVSADGVELTQLRKTRNFSAAAHTRGDIAPATASAGAT